MASTDETLKQLKDIDPALYATIDGIIKASKTVPETERALYIALSQQYDSLNRPMYTDEQIKAITDDVIGSSFTSDYGTFAETKVKGLVPVNLQQSIPNPNMGLGEATKRAMSRQAYIPKGDVEGESIRGKYEETYDLTPEIVTVLPELLKESFSVGDKEVDNYVNAFLKVYGSFKGKGLTQDKALKETLNTLQGLSSVKTLGEDPKKATDDVGSLLSEALKMDTTAEGGKIPDFKNEQLLFMQQIKEGDVQRAIQDELYFLEQEKNVPIPHYRFKIDGDEYTIPVSVYEYFQTKKSLSDDVYSKVNRYLSQYDDTFKKYFTDSRLSAMLPKTEVSVLPSDMTDANYNAMLRVSAYDKVGGDEWYLDPIRKTLVMSNPDAYQNLAATFKHNILTPEQSILGGTVETPVGYTLRSAMTIPNMITAAGIEYGVYPILEMATGEDIRGAAKEQRAKTQPIFENYPVLGMIASDKGVTGFVGDALDAYGVTGAARRNIDAGLIGFDLVLNPDMAIATGLAKGTLAMGDVAKLNKTRKALGEATNASDYSKVFATKAAQEILDDYNLISLTAKKVAPETVSKIKKSQVGNGVVLLQADVQNSLDARRIANNSSTPRQTLKDTNLDNSGYGKALQKMVDDGIDEVSAARQLDRIYTENKALKEFDEYSRILENSKRDGIETSISKAKEQGVKADLDYLEDVVKRYPKIEDAQNVLNTVYARKIVYENLDENLINAFEKIRFVSKDAAVHNELYPEFLARAKQDPLAKVLREIITPKTEMALEVKPAVQAKGAYTPTDVVSLGEPDVAFRLLQYEINALKTELDNIQLPETIRQSIEANLEQGKLFKSDYNELLDRISSRTAKEMEAGVTIEDISRLTEEQQARLREPIGTSRRTKGNLTRRINEWIGQKFTPAAAKQQLDAAKTPSVAPVNVLSYKQREMIHNIQRQMSGLDSKLNKQLKELLNEKSVQEVYGTPSDIDGVDAMGYLIVGVKQTDDLALKQQTKNLESTLSWMFSQLIYTSKQVPNMNYFDRTFSYKQIVLDNLYSIEGQKAFETYIANVAVEIMNNKSNFWDIFQSRLDEWTNIIKNERIQIMDPEDPTRVAKEVLYYKIRQDIDIKTLNQVDAADFEKIVEKLSLGTYFYAEAHRIHDKMLVDFLNREVKPTDVETMFKGQDVTQDMFNNVLKASMYALATETRITTDVMANIRDYVDVELRYQKAFGKMDKEDIVSFQTKLNDEIRDLSNSKQTELRFERDELKSAVKDDSGVDVAMETLQSLYKQDIEAIRLSKEEKIAKEYAPIKAEYEKKITAIKETKEDTAIQKINKHYDGLTKKEKAPVEAKRIEDIDASTAKYNQAKKDLRADVETELKSLGGQNLKRDQINEAQKQISANYKREKKRLLDDYKVEQKRINDKAEADKTAIDEKYKRLADKSKEQYKALNKDELSEVQKLRKELASKESEIRNKYEKERKEQAQRILEQRKEIEKAEKEGIAEINKQQRDEISADYNERIKQIDVEYSNLRQKGMIAQLQWLSENIDLTGTEFEKVHAALQEASDPTLVSNIANKTNEYGSLILRNNNMLQRSDLTMNELENMLDGFMKMNPEWGKSLFGRDAWKEFESNFSRYGLSNTERSIKEWLLTQPLPSTTKMGNVNNDVSGLDIISKFFGYINQLFYVGILGYASRSHGQNILTGNFISYATTGQMLRSKDTVMKAWNVITHGSNKGSLRANDIAVVTPTGQMYTNSEIYDSIVNSGVRLQYNFINDILSEGKLLTFLRANNGKYKGFNKRFMDKMADMVNRGLLDPPSNLLVKEDMAYRSGAMIEALKQGSSYDEAVNVARRSLFDYQDLTQAEKALSTYAFVFYNFTRQNFVDAVLGMSNPTIFKRYLNMIKIKRDTAQIARSLNDEKDFPHEAFFPNYTATRTIASYNKGDSESSYDWFTMTPSMPVIDNLATLFNVINFDGTYQEETAVLRGTEQFITPSLKMILGLSAKYKRKQFKPEYVNILKTVAGDQEELIGMMETIVGGRVKVTISDAEQYATKGVNSDTMYIYELDKEQFQRMLYFEYFAQQLGLQRIAVDYSKIFLSTEGTTWQNLSPTERALSGIGAITPGRMKKPEIQDTERIVKMLQELNRIRNESVKEEEQKYKP